MATKAKTVSSRYGRSASKKESYSSLSMKGSITAEADRRRKLVQFLKDSGVLAKDGSNLSFYVMTGHSSGVSVDLIGKTIEIPVDTKHDAVMGIIFSSLYEMGKADGEIGLKKRIAALLRV